MASIIKSMLENPCINKEFEKLIAADLLPILQNETNMTENFTALHLIKKTNNRRIILYKNLFIIN
ncbi:MULTISPECIES: hypothetical protein [Proteus]|nr:MULTISPECIES: hypothetical protein [Proteus]MCG9960185.1 hypothetical protein [Proteus mirabilis]MCL8557491.1 hypothetical protein [Proteus mirabilis]MCL8614998.1 hypothetical protein [Proteus mirabilis]MCL9987109.1 hypothetical protein [Proteus mirabilis]MCM0023970.1 hypothetical protein [Proteus mirabilis]